MGILGIDLNNINLDDANDDEVDYENFIHIRLLVWHIKFEKWKPARYLERWRKSCMTEDEKKEMEAIFKRVILIMYWNILLHKDFI